MKKKIIILLTIIIAVIICITVVAMYFMNNSKDRLKNIYNKMTANQTYTFSINNQNEENKTVTRRKGDNVIIDTYNSGNHASTLIKEGNTYYIEHKIKEYYTYINSESDKELLTNTLKKVIEKDHTDGNEEINGKKYYYEEYTEITDFLINTYKDMDLSTVKTRFYFKGAKLEYIKTTYQTIDPETGETNNVEELLNVEIEYKVDDNIFKIPEGYAEG